MRDPVSETAHYVASVFEDGSLVLVQHGCVEQPGCVLVTRGSQSEGRSLARHLLCALERLLIG